ncbi:MAG TPA: amino acid adenylation domain-containing protein [Micromonosporaceae bacterium]|nr:amino acid adenylation domain-containing protein [Micromonosporaceae bacterium]
MRLHDYVREWATRTPDATAVGSLDGSATYAELDALAQQQAAGLRAVGVAAGDRVVLWAAKSVSGVALMQAALRVGAAYVPVAPTNPAARMSRIAADAGARVIVTDQAQGERSSPAGQAGQPVALTFTELAELGAAGPAAPGPAVDAGPDDPAYLLYTSGSTGTPKGVCLSHRNGAAFVEWAADLLAVAAADRLANHAPFNFDLSVFDIYAAFRAGGSVHLVPEQLSYAPQQLVRFIRDTGITVWYSVPSALVLMIRDGGLLDGGPPPGLRACVFAGEPMPIPYVHQLREAWPGVRLMNWYGPTETNVCTWYEVSDADTGRTRPLPIGRAACGDTVLLDPAYQAAGDQAGPGSGAEGEIVVSGPTVMLGYSGHPPQAGPYRTGDLGRLDANGDIEYLGRLDNMVKLRGHRVEPAEVEAVIAGHPRVADVAVVVVGTGLEARLYAVVVPAGGDGPGLLEIKRWCAQRLPTYMIVDVLRVVEKLPLTLNGKTDRAALVAGIEEVNSERS